MLINDIKPSKVIFGWMTHQAVVHVMKPLGMAPLVRKPSLKDKRTIFKLLKSLI